VQRWGILAFSLSYLVYQHLEGRSLALFIVGGGGLTSEVGEEHFIWGA
jgi:hypothetical protein